MASCSIYTQSSHKYCPPHSYKYTGCLLARKVMKVIKKSCIFLSGHKSHEKVMNFWQNYLSIYSFICWRVKNFRKIMFVSHHIKFILINNFLNSKVYMSRENKTFNGGTFEKKKGKSHGSGHEKGHEQCSYLTNTVHVGAFAGCQFRLVF